jgi:hypothetical protein
MNILKISKNKVAILASILSLLLISSSALAIDTLATNQTQANVAAGLDNPSASNLSHSWFTTTATDDG